MTDETKDKPYICDDCGKEVGLVNTFLTNRNGYSKSVCSDCFKDYEKYFYMKEE